MKVKIIRVEKVCYDLEMKYMYQITLETEDEPKIKLGEAELVQK